MAKSKLSLKGLAAHYRVSQRVMLQTLLAEKQSSLLEAMGSAEQDAFYDGSQAA